MAKFKSPIKIRAVKESKEFEAGEVFEMTVKRANELERNIKAQKGYEGYALERVDDEEKAEPREEVEETKEGK